MSRREPRPPARNSKEVPMTKKSAFSLSGSLFAVMLIAIAHSAVNGVAQAQPAAVSTTPGPAAKAAGQESTAKPSPTAQAINSGQAVYLVRSTLMMLNDANRSGNYTVLRDLAAPDFQARNSAADLAQSFADLRRRNFDLFAAAILAPQFTAGPAVDANGRLRLIGFFPTSPQRINFDLTFQSVGGQWRLFALAVATPQAPTTQSQLPQRKTPGLFYGVRGLAGIAGWRW